MLQTQNKDNFQYGMETYGHQAVLHNLKIATGLMSATLAMPIKLCFIQSHLLFSSQEAQFSLLSHFFLIPQGPYYLHKS